MQKHYTITDVAHAYDLHPETVREYCRDGKIDFTRFGRSYRFSDDQLTEFEKKSGASTVRVNALVRVERRLAKAK